MTNAALPHDLDSEKALLGACLFENRVIDDLDTLIEPEDFYNAAHECIYLAILDLHAHGVGVDLVTLCNALRASKSLEKCGGATYLSQLEDFVPTVRHHREYARAVKEMSLKRKLLMFAQEMGAEGRNPSRDVSEIVQEFGDRLIQLSVNGRAEIPPTIGDSLKGALDQIDALYKSGKALRGIPTGFPSLDRRTHGKQPGQLILLAGRPSMGKTALALQMAEHDATHGHKPLFFSAEMEKEQLISRIIAAKAHVPYECVQTGQDWDKHVGRATAACGELYALPFRIDDQTHQVEKIRALTKQMVLRKQCDIVYVDFLQILSTVEKTLSRHDWMSKITLALKRLAKECRIPVVALCQLSRAVELRDPPRPQLSDLKESGDIEQTADVVWFLYRPEYYRIQAGEDVEENLLNLCEVITGKGRNVKTGTDRLNFFGEIQRFEERNDGYGPF